MQKKEPGFPESTVNEFTSAAVQIAHERNLFYPKSRQDSLSPSFCVDFKLVKGHGISSWKVFFESELCHIDETIQSWKELYLSEIYACGMVQQGEVDMFDISV